jgi:dTDP-4-dehydrorhamnose 3,5-epimerase
MIFTETKVQGAFRIDVERRVDHRGYFARAFCQQEFSARGLNPHIAQVNVSRTLLRGALRGLHYQLPPYQEAKVVSCTRGAIYDVVLDLRPHSPTYLKWDAAELTADNRSLLYLPEGCAHGFQALAPDSEVLYLMSEFYAREHASGVRYDDSAFQIAWPLPVADLSDADRCWPDYAPRGPAPEGPR